MLTIDIPLLMAALLLVFAGGYGVCSQVEVASKT